MANRIIAGRYHLVRKLGTGGMGKVFLVADQEHQGELLALKTLRRNKLQEKYLQYFRSEFLLTRQLSHPNVARVFDFGITHPGHLFFTLEYVEGIDLYELGKDLSDWVSFYSTLAEIALGMEYIHASGFIHYDIKPSNIMVRSDRPPGERIKIMDFGLAGEFKDEKGKRIKGTAHYMAPEMISSPRVDKRIDIYSLGVTLYHVVTRTLPFQGDSSLAVIRKHAEENPPSPCSIRPDIPAPLEGMILRMMHKDPSRRYQSAYQVAEEAAALAGIPVSWTEPVAIRPCLFGGRFVGRDRERFLLKNSFERLGPGKPGHLVGISGEIGSGKRRLLREFQVSLQIAGVVTVVTDGKEHRREPFGAVRDLLKKLLLLQGLAEEEGRELHFTAWPGYAALAGHKLFPGARGLPPLPPYGDNPEQEHQLLLCQLRELFRGLSEKSSLVAFVLHAAQSDPGTRDLFSAWAHPDGGDHDLSPPPGLLVCLTHNLGEEDDQWPPLFQTELRLLPLPEEDLSHWLQDLLGASPPLTFQQEIQRHTGGNPLFVEETLQSLIRSGVLRYRRGHWEPQGTSWTWPASLHELMEHRLRNLGTEEQRLLLLLSLLHRPLSAPLLLELSADLEPAVRENALHRLLTLQLVEISEETPGPAYQLAYPVYGTFLQGRAPAVDLAQWHRQLAELLEPQVATHSPLIYELARLFSAAGVRDKAFRYLRMAGDEHSRFYNPEPVAEYYRAALALKPEGDRETAASLRNDLAKCFMTLGRWDEAVQLYRENLAEAPSPEEAARDERKIAQILAKQGKYREAAEHLRDSLSRLGPGTELEQLQQSLALAKCLLQAGELADASATGKQCLLLLSRYRGQRKGSCVELAYNVNEILASIASRQGNPGEALGFFHDNINMQRQALTPHHLAGTYHNLGRLYLQMGQARKAALHLGRALKLRRKIGDRLGEALLLNSVGNLLVWRMENHKALRYFRDSLEIYRAYRDGSGLAMALFNVGLVLAEHGEYERALATMEQSLRRQESLRLQEHHLMSWLHLGSLHLTLGETDAAIKAIRKGMLEEGARAGESSALGARLLGRLAHLKGNRTEALSQLSSAARQYEAIGARNEELDTALERLRLLFLYDRAEEAVQELPSLDEAVRSGSSPLVQLNFILLCRLGELLFGEKRAAEHYLETTLASFPENDYPERRWEIHHLLGRGFEMIRKPSAALLHYKRAMECLQSVFSRLTSPRKAAYLEDWRKQDLKNRMHQLLSGFPPS